MLRTHYFITEAVRASREALIKPLFTSAMLISTISHYTLAADIDDPSRLSDQSATSSVAKASMAAVAPPPTDRLETLRAGATTAAAKATLQEMIDSPSTLAALLSAPGVRVSEAAADDASLASSTPSDETAVASSSSGPVGSRSETATVRRPIVERASDLLGGMIKSDRASYQRNLSQFHALVSSDRAAAIDALWSIALDESQPLPVRKRATKWLGNTDRLQIDGKIAVLIRRLMDIVDTEPLSAAGTEVRTIALSKALAIASVGFPESRPTLSLLVELAFDRRRSSNPISSAVIRALGGLLSYYEAGAVAASGLQRIMLSTDTDPAVRFEVLIALTKAAGYGGSCGKAPTEETFEITQRTLEEAAAQNSRTKVGQKAQELLEKLAATRDRLDQEREAEAASATSD